MERAVTRLKKCTRGPFMMFQLFWEGRKGRGRSNFDGGEVTFKERSSGGYYSISISEDLGSSRMGGAMRGGGRCGDEYMKKEGRKWDSKALWVQGKRRRCLKGSRESFKNLHRGGSEVMRKRLHQRGSGTSRKPLTVRVNRSSDRVDGAPLGGSPHAKV